MKKNIPIDYRVIYDIIQPRSRVLDLGCGKGELLSLLNKEKDAVVQGIELNDEAIYKCVEKGLSVFHSDIDSGLHEYPDKSFDYVILNQSMQQVKRIDFVIQEALRVGKKVIVGFPNFASFRARAMLCFQGKAPITESLPYQWYNTPNLRFLSISDFRRYCRENKIKVIRRYCLGKASTVWFWPNLFALNAIYLLTKENNHK
jgi:methionine biosynthesis protein MetW